MIQELCFGEIKRKSNFTKTIASFFFTWKPFWFHSDLQFSKPATLFQKKSSPSGDSFTGCIDDIFCSAISMTSLMVLSKLNSTALSITIQILFHLCWKIFSLAIYMKSSTFQTGLLLKILLPCYIAWLKIINFLQHYLMTLPNYQ